MREQWTKIENYPMYEVSSYGRVRSWKKRGPSKDKRKEPLVLSPHTDIQKRKSVAIMNKDGRKTLRIHQLVAKAFIPNTENKPHINHKDSNPSNNRVENLEWCTPSENMKHGYKYGKKEHGENHFATTLTEKEVLEIRAAWPLGCFSKAEIARSYDVDPATIFNIINRKTWVHL